MTLPPRCERQTDTKPFPPHRIVICPEPAVPGATFCVDHLDIDRAAAAAAGFGPKDTPCRPARSAYTDDSAGDAAFWRARLRWERYLAGYGRVSETRAGILTVETLDGYTTAWSVLHAYGIHPPTEGDET